MKEFVANTLMLIGMMLLVVAMIISIPVTLSFLLIIAIIFGIPSIFIFLATRLI